MSLPRELLDQLLSGYLDDALSPDERARVEQLLHSDDEIVKELNQLRELQRSLQAVSAADSAIKLEKGFADRVLGAAVARAHAEGLSDDHPLILLAEQPSTSRSGTSPSLYRSSSLRVAGVLVGLAASIVIAVLTLRPDTSPIAQSQPDAQSLAVDVEDTLTDPIENPVAVPTPQMVVSDSAANPSLSNPSLSNPNSADPVTPAPVTEPISTDSLMKQLEHPPAPIEAIAKSQDPVEPPAASKIEISKMSIGPILVLDVRRTEAGRNSDPIGDALAYAKIEPASEKKITEEIAGFAKSTLVKADENASILYLQVPGKKADLFYLRLMADQVGIESVGLRIAMDAPITKMVDAIRPEPTTVRHNDAALQLFSDGGVVDEFTSHLGQLDYRIPDRKAMDGMPSATTGPDISAEILVLVR